MISPIFQVTKLFMVLLSICLLIPSPAISDDMDNKNENESGVESFSYLKKLGDSGLVHYNPAISTVINTQRDQLDPNHPMFIDKTDDRFDLVCIKTKFEENSSEHFYIVFSEGPSADFAFEIFNDDNPPKRFGSIGGLKMYIPGNGFIYVTGHINNMFDQRRKIVYRDGKFLEITQPYYYVGLKTHTVKTVVLFSDLNCIDTVAVIPAEFNVEVLVANVGKGWQDYNYFLVKTPLGLVGWAKIPVFSYENSIKGLYYAGD